MPSSIAAVPYTAPLRIESTVLVAMTFFGAVMDIEGRRLVPAASAP